MISNDNHPIILVAQNPARNAQESCACNAALIARIDAACDAIDAALAHLRPEAER